MCGDIIRSSVSGRYKLSIRPGPLDLARRPASEEAPAIEDIYPEDICIDLIDTTKIDAIVTRHSQGFMKRIDATGFAEIMPGYLGIELSTPFPVTISKAPGASVKSDMTAPLRRQIEQLHLKPLFISSRSNENDTAPQWQLPL